MSGDGKRPKEFSINEVSRMTGVPSHTIRFWERDFGAYLHPSRTSGGQRRYSSSDVDVVEQIKHFRYYKKHTVKGTLEELNRGPLSNKEIENAVDEMARIILRKVMEKIAQSR
jgi:DNA-binding transcriptional MerR regulator